ncbi:FtsK/SpoIIIE domain-containing protein [Streptomyces sp. NPDC001922]|uniref:FtsK/SpoIIIE domain-containing protein n=1 Tax=Streptomyces sp. NPDC001922 TaxID=3364624 RepID=UPI0036C07793
MQIRLTVLGPRGGHAARVCDVLVTAPPGTALAAVASGLAAAVAASSGATPPAPGRRDGSAAAAGATGAGSSRAGGESAPDSSGSGPVVLYVGAERLDAQRCALGEPPLTDGAVLSLGGPAEPERHPGGPPVLPSGAPAQLHVVAGPDAGGVHLLHGGQIRIGRSADADVPLDDPDVSRLHCAVTVADDGRVTVADLNSTNGTALDGEPVGGAPAPVRPGALLRLGESALRLVAAPGPAVGAPAAPAGTPVPGALQARPDGEGHLRVAVGAAAEGVDGRDPVGPVTRSGGDAPQAGDGGGTVAGWGYAESMVTRPGTAAGGPYPASATRPGEQDSAATHPGRHSLAGPGPEGAPRQVRRVRGIGAWARRLAGARADAGAVPGAEPPQTRPVVDTAAEEAAAKRWPDPSEVLLTALGPGPRLWERGPGHPDTLVVRLGTADRPGAPAAPVTLGLRQTGSLGLAGPRARLTGLARSVVAQLAALHPPGDLEIVLISTDRERPAAERLAEWGWLGWLPQVRPAHGQDCRLLLAHDRDQAAARTGELVRRLDDGPLGPSWITADRAAIAEAAGEYDGPYTLVIVDGDPGSAALRGTTARLAAGGPAAGIHVLCLAETPAASPASPLSVTLDMAREASAPFSECGAAALLSGDVATALRVMHLGPAGPVNNGVVATVDAVSAAWAERFARALAPLRAADTGGDGPRRVAAPLPRTARLLDELGLARATPASLMARWAAAADTGPAEGGRVCAVLGAGPHGPLSVDPAADGPHLLVEGGPGSGKTELLRSMAASLAAADRPDRVALVLVDGGGAERGEGLRVCTELPHVSTYLAAADPVRMRAFAQALGTELKRRAELIGDGDFTDWHTRRAVADRMVAPRRPRDPDPVADRHGDLESAPSGTLKLRARGGGSATGAGPAGAGLTADAPAGEEPPALPRLVVLVDDYDELVAPGLGSPGRPAAGSVVRALEAVAREGARLGVHLIAATGRPDRTAETAAAQQAGLRIALEILPAEGPGPARPEAGGDAGEPAPGRGRLLFADGSVAPFQAGRVTGRIPRTATLRPTVVPLEWERMGDPPTRRPVRELGNGPTDLALLASALHRAAQSAQAPAAPPLLST